MKNIAFALSLVALSFDVHSQVKEFDKLEQLYHQQHYRLVYIRANKLLDKPDFDFSQLPKFYKSLSMFQLAQNTQWLKRNPKALQEAASLFQEVKKSQVGYRVFTAHLYEVSELKEDLYAFGEDLNRTGNNLQANELKKILSTLFNEVPSIGEKDKNPQLKTSPIGNDKRSQMIVFAEKQIGVPYSWGGTSPKGFDCSGFTSYVLAEFNITLPRRAADQQKSSAKLKQKNVQKGDLVFFNNGSGISHVGIIVSETGEPLKMIHASSSKGVIITDLQNSSYWMNRLDSFGTYLN